MSPGELVTQWASQKPKTATSPAPICIVNTWKFSQQLVRHRIEHRLRAFDRCAAFEAHEHMDVREFFAWIWLVGCDPEARIGAARELKIGRHHTDDRKLAPAEFE